MIFNGKAFAREIEANLRQRLRRGVRVPKIVSILVGDHPSSTTSEWHGDPASLLYTRLKKEAAERVGIQFEVVKIDSGIKIQELGEKITEIGSRRDVDGVMVQLPLPELLRGSTSKLLEAIPLAKDVDGLRWEESGVNPATVRAILSIVDEIAVGKTKFVVLGAKGAVGRPLKHFLRERGVEVSEVEWDTPNSAELIKQGEVVISCVGKAGLVMGEMVKGGVIAIDVGSPKGDMTPDVYQKASVAVPVPGGVGPVTIACLLLNTVEIYGKSS